MLQPRPPIVVILGHVDHGKTTLLDYLRKTNLAAREPGGITQHIRSFQLNPPQPITFIDTPGHAAFTAMRQRGSRIADLAVLVIAANDGVMPQTKQSIEFIQKARLPFVVAISKSDLPSSDPDRVKTQLTESQVVVEDYGGDVPAVSISGKTGAGIPDLLEILHLLSELHPPQANATGQLEAVVLESRFNSQTGSTAVVIVKNGTLSLGQKLFQAGPIGKVRNLIDSIGQPVKFASPSTPVEIIGLSLVPDVGSTISDSPIAISMPPASHPQTPTTPASLKLVVKADVTGSLEAILASLPATLQLVSSGIGDINETEVTLAHTSNCPILAFNVKIPQSVAKLAEVEKVTIYSHKVIYELLDQVNELLHPQVTETILGQAQIIAEFKINSDRIAGCRATTGVIDRSTAIRLLRQEVVVGETKIRSLKSGKTDVPSVKPGSEFGAVFSPPVNFQIGDILQSYKTL